RLSGYEMSAAINRTEDKQSPVSRPNFVFGRAQCAISNAFGKRQPCLQAVVCERRRARSSHFSCTSPCKNASVRISANRLKKTSAVLVRRFQKSPSVCRTKNLSFDNAVFT